MASQFKSLCRPPLPIPVLLLALTATLLLSPSVPAAGATPDGSAGELTERPRAKRQTTEQRHTRHNRSRSRDNRARPHQKRRARHAKLGKVSNAIAVTRRRGPAAAPATASQVLDAGFEDGLLNWNTAGVGDVEPTVVNDIVRSGSWSGRVLLSSSQDRSELILGGNGGGSANGMIEFREGEEYWYGFSFYIESMVYGEPGAHNLIMQFKGEGEGSPAFGLQLWDYAGDDDEYADNPRGLWSHGSSMGGDRFLAPAPERTWHDVALHFRASSDDGGFYELYLDGRLIDSRSGVGMIADGASYAYIKNGLYRNGREIPGTSDLRLDAARLGPTRDSVLPG